MPDSDCEISSWELNERKTIKDTDIEHSGWTPAIGVLIRVILPWGENTGWKTIMIGYENRLMCEHDGEYRSIEYIAWEDPVAWLRVCTEKESSWWWKIFKYFFGDVKTLLVAAFDILGKKWADVTGAIAAAIDDLQSWSQKTFTDAADDLIAAFQDKFAASETKAVAFLTALGIGAGDVITTILDTPADMFAWIKSEIEAAYSIVLHTWSEVEDLIPSWSDLIPEGFPASLDDLKTLIESYIPELPDWFPTSLDELKTLIVTTISDAFESILDKVFKK